MFTTEPFLMQKHTCTLQSSSIAILFWVRLELMSCHYIRARRGILRNLCYDAMNYEQSPIHKSVNKHNSQYILASLITFTLENFHSLYKCINLQIQNNSFKQIKQYATYKWYLFVSDFMNHVLFISFRTAATRLL
jgi:hypothetical protein